MINLLPKNLRGRDKKETPKDLKGTSMEELIIPEKTAFDHGKKQDKNGSKSSGFFNTLGFWGKKKDKKNEVKKDNLEDQKRAELESVFKKRMLSNDKKGESAGAGNVRAVERGNKIYRPFDDDNNKTDVVIAGSFKPVIKEEKPEKEKIIGELGGKKMKKKSFWSGIFTKKVDSNNNNKKEKSSLLDSGLIKKEPEKVQAVKPPVPQIKEAEILKKPEVMPNIPLPPKVSEPSKIKEEKNEKKNSVIEKKGKIGDKTAYNKIELDVREKAKKLAGLKAGGKDVNFILEEYSGALRVKIIKKVSYLVAIFIFLISVVFIFQLILDYRKGELRKTGAVLAEENEKLKNEIQKYLKYKDSAYDMDIKMAKVGYLLDKHIYWSNLFKFLEENTLENVYYLNFESGGTKQISLQARTTTFDNLSKQYGLFSSLSELESVKIDSGTSIKGADGEGYVQFNVILTFKEEFFLR